jgi:hypothetical protein
VGRAHPKLNPQKQGYMGYPFLLGVYRQLSEVSVVHISSNVGSFPTCIFRMSMRNWREPFIFISPHVMDREASHGQLALFIYVITLDSIKNCKWAKSLSIKQN